jgi:hypothetical protein
METTQTRREAPAVRASDGFNPRDHKTWGLTLSAIQVAAVLDYNAGYVRRRARLGRFQPAPRTVLGRSPRWHRDDVLAHVEGR